MNKKLIKRKKIFQKCQNMIVARSLSSGLGRTCRTFSSSRDISVSRIASVLKLNVKDEANAVKFDNHMKKLTKKMQAHPGMESATRYVCKTEWAYELSFVFSDVGSFTAWKTSDLRDDVHADYLAALAKCGIDEEVVYGGARVYDTWK
tara:strand:- start:85 stop:528 length:444 start_codon:yes stop_codon:yes gene_type:complete